MCFISSTVFLFVIKGTRFSVNLLSVGGCDMLDNPENGVVETTGFAPSDTATYTCNSGLELVGTRVRTCGTDGEWSDVPPTCRRKLRLTQ